MVLTSLGLGCRNPFQTYRSKFSEQNCIRPTFTSNLFKQLDITEVLLLDLPFTMQEIKDAVWECGGDKAPSVNGFTFKFIKSHWDILGHDIFCYMKEFETSSLIPRGCNSSFITSIPKVEDPLVIHDYRPISLIGCQYKIIAKAHANRLALVISSVVGESQTAFIKGRQIIDGPLMVDKIISWAKMYNKKLFMLKVDFEKAFDSISWSFLDSTMMQMGFSFKWRQWMRACLNSGYTSVLVNGSPTPEFKIERSLRQGDPLSPLLFILAIEALNVILTEAKSKNLFKGVKVEKDKG
ncbi:cysteine-rich receptor-like protein kinase [Tanacetum coccineum]